MKVYGPQWWIKKAYADLSLKLLRRWQDFCYICSPGWNWWWHYLPNAQFTLTIPPVNKTLLAEIPHSASAMLEGCDILYHKCTSHNSV